MIPFPARRLLPLLLVAVLPACSLAPAYQKPDVGPLPASFAGQTQDGLWSPAHPADTASRGPWWSVYGNDELDRLEKQLDASNPSLSVALARYDAARALTGQVRSDLYPHLGVGASDLRNRQSDNRPLRGSNQPNEYSAETFGFAAGYELDLWGRVRNEVAAGKANEAAAADDLASAKLSLEAQLADLYIRLRGYDVQDRILKDTLDAYRQGLDMTERRFQGGVASGLDVSRAKTQLSDAMAQVSEVEAQRALILHAIAALVGEPASRFTLATTDAPLPVPAIPLGVPSTLLERRPDIAAAERRVFAANAQIGVARAAFFPRIALDAAYGWQDTGGELLTAGNRYWALGPELAMSLFDGGLRHSRVQAAQANLDAAAGQYRQTVLAAFQQVEDNLTLLQQLGKEAHQQDDAASAAHDSQAIATNRYREGAVNYLDVVSAQTAALQAERSAEQVRTRRLQASVDLIRALGGGWDSSQLAEGRTPMSGTAPQAR
ncbi:MAG TPA: efflux transporter outer membrane subunit [Dyella sp.]|uniref:efflux transporter outer membrane subunit n=1 Tax=Dyella sp. TaxID=1869338 RepID=UPI002D798817|nr:efflux transporter outer membrane subunit [Dyella sp.]HET6552719.1 efflux transporter outer membrane subunit [Dyella sp.]